MRFDSTSVFRWAQADQAVWMGAATLWTARFLIGFAGIFGTFVYLLHQSLLRRLQHRSSQAGLSAAQVVVHLAALAAFFGLSEALSLEWIANSVAWVAALLWLASGIALLSSAAWAVLPWRLWRVALNTCGTLPWFAALAAAVASSLGGFSKQLWVPMSGVTFRAVEVVLRPLLQNMIVDPEHMRIGSTRCTAIISPECSGLEGATLMLVFLAVWLLLFRSTLRFPQALLVLPAGVVLLLFMNVLRIAVLILIGHAGYRNIAAQGFHSEAGWILFNLVAFGIAVGARKIAWIGTELPTRNETVAVPDETAAYLVPFLALLAAGMLAHAASGGVQWWYGLRIFAVGGALWWFRPSYTRQRLWAWNWVAIATGVLVFLVWVICAKLLPWGEKPVPMPRDLAAASDMWRAVWIGSRFLTATVFVPIAEELAFRGYLLRRLSQARWEQLLPRSVTTTAVLASSALFGVLHGDRWVEAALAGVLFALVYRWNGKLGDAVTAHAVANAVLGIYVLTLGDWSFWT